MTSDDGGRHRVAADEVFGSDSRSRLDSRWPVRPADRGRHDGLIARVYSAPGVSAAPVILSDQNDCLTALVIRWLPGVLPT